MIEKSTFATDGCVFTIAACSVTTEMATGKMFRECIKINESAILNYLGNMPEDHRHCALLASMTFHKALRECADMMKKG